MMYSLFTDTTFPLTLNDPSRFGAFGPISSARMIQSKQPHQAYIRFEHEVNATNAMRWINTQLSYMGLSAKNGYQKYCTKFLQRKPCTRHRNRHSCGLLHSWKPFTEVLNQEKVHQLNPLKRQGHPSCITAGPITNTPTDAPGASLPGAASQGILPL